MEYYYLWFKKHWLDFLIVLYIFFIFYSTIVPFNFVTDTSDLLTRLSKIDFIPFGGIQRAFSRSDALANILFFMPLGVLLAAKIILRYYRNFLFKDWMSILAIGFSVSLCVEIFQIFTYDRHTSATDLLMNSIGTLLGAAIMLLIYLKFRVSAKKMLFTLFAAKPEMIIAGLFSLFIFVSYSIPFTFQPSLQSLRQHLNVLWHSSVNWQNVLMTLPAQFLIYGSLSYFLLAGIFKYFKQDLKKISKILLLMMLLLVPVVMEIYQILIPVRNHSFGDIFSGILGVLLGYIIFALPGRSRKMPGGRLTVSDNYPVTEHTRYFQFMIVTYIFYLILFFNYQQPLLISEDLYRELFVSLNRPPYNVMRYMRLNLLIQFAKEVFTFLPAGFILSLISVKFGSGKKKFFTVMVLLFLVLYMGLALSQGADNVFFLILGLGALLLGTFLGYALYEIYIYLLKKDEISKIS